MPLPDVITIMIVKFSVLHIDLTYQAIMQHPFLTTSCKVKEEQLSERHWCLHDPGGAVEVFA